MFWQSGLVKIPTTRTHVDGFREPRKSGAVFNAGRASGRSKSSNRWWPTTAGLAAAVKAASRRRRWPQASLYSGDRPSHPLTEGRWPRCERFLSGPRCGCCQTQRQQENAKRAARNALMASAGYFYAPVAAFRFLSAADAIAVRFTASGPAHRKHGVSGVGRPGGAIRQLTVAGLCTPTGTAGTALDGDA
jgi:hypothetical protein